MNNTANLSCTTIHQGRSIQPRSMLHSPIHLHEVDESLYIDSISDIARKMHGVAMFIKTEYCTGLQAATMPTRKILGELVDRLLNYGWPLVSADTGDELDLPGDKNVLEGREAVEAMEYLAWFFEQSVGHLRAVELSKDLRFAARYTEALMDALPKRDDLVANEERSVDHTVLSSGPAGNLDGGSVTGNGHRERLLGMDIMEKDTTGPPLYPAVQHQVHEGFADQSSSMQLRPGAKSLFYKSPSVVENVTWKPALATVDEDAPSDISSLGLETQHATSISDDEELLRYEAPLQESEVPDIPRELRGKRLSSRSWFESDPQFSELIGKIEQWQDSHPDYDFTTIRGGSNNPEDPIDHFCNAIALGISALVHIKCEHPLDPAIVKHVDIDILRFVRLALWDWTNGHIERLAERESLEIVRREIGIRKREAAAKESSQVERRAGSAVSSDDPPWEVLFDIEKPDGQDGLAPDGQGEQSRRSFQTADTIIDPQDSDVDLAFAWLDLNDEATGDEYQRSSSQFKLSTYDSKAAKTIKAASSNGSENFSTLLHRSRSAAQADTATNLESVSSKLVPLAQTERLARLEWENGILRAKLAELREEFESLRSFDISPIGSRTDDPHAHRPQHLVARRVQPSSSSMQAETDSTSDSVLDEDNDLERYTRNDLVSMLEFLKSEPPPDSPNAVNDGSKGKWSHTFNEVFSRIRGPVRASRHRSSVYEVEDGAPHAYVPTRAPSTRASPTRSPPTKALRSSRGRGRVQISEGEVNGGDVLHSGYIFPQPGGISMREV